MKEAHYQEKEQMTAHRVGKYACLEIEFRYLLSRIPDDLPGSDGGWRITDRYLPNTRLRLRHMKSLSGEENIYKLTQKYRSGTQNAYETTITNLYLTEAEYRHFDVLEAGILEKRCYSYPLPGFSLRIDVFEGRHQGLLLAEMEVEQKEGIDGPALPPFVLKDVTDDPFFTGGSLAAMTDEEFRQGLLQRLRDHQDL
jgi:CYTH domain-containing protein